MIRRGGQGPLVREAQRHLARRGYPIEADGIFGPKTERAVVQLQQAHGLTVDGIVGPETWRELRVVDRIPPSHLADARAGLLEEARWQASGVRLAAIKAAVADLGLRERPPGSNAGPEIAHLVEGYREEWGIPAGGRAPPWCAIAASQWVRRGLEVEAWEDTPMGAWLGGVWQWREFGRRAGCLVTPDELDAEAGAGAIFLMPRAGSGSDPARSTRAGHCGLVAAVDGQVLRTIEANVGDAVAEGRRTLDEVGELVLWWGAT